ncbi:hypothetical protein PVAG01_05326 [Phlyctema vagabunda]|uniref:Uncharacterized protein n=1 Tax=Phlyctema vagabunda TaxID=108571 RepID=A0ABR4PJS0_9HELO
MLYSIILSAFAATAVMAQSTTSSATDPCDLVYNACIQEAVTKGESPNFSTCNARRAACAGSASATATSSFLICNAAAIARGDCTATAASVPTTTSTSTSPCDLVYNACIQRAVTMGESPNFSSCSAEEAACSATVSATPAPTSTASTTYSPCDQVYNACIQEAVNKGESPNFSTCNARKAACAGTVSATPAPTSTAATTYSPCDQVYNACIQEAVTKGESPNFSTCNSRRAACAGTASATGTIHATVTSQPTMFTGAANMNGPAMGLMALGALALL